MLSTMEAAPPVGYARSGDVHVAYSITGDGPIDLVMVDGSLTNLSLMWEEPGYRDWIRRLSTFARVIRFDKRGMGLSDRVQAGGLEERMDDVRAVMDAVGSERAALVGESEGGPLSMLFAATYPQRTVALILCGAEVKEEKTDDWPWGEGTREDFEDFMQLDTIAARWGKGLALPSFAPSRADDERLRELFGRVQAQAASPPEALDFMRMAFEIDVRHVAPSINTPTLVVHRQGDRVCHVENGRWLANNITGAKYVELPGDDHISWIDS